MTGGVALQAVITGLSSGAVYGLVALGFTLVHRLTRVYALAHGDVVVASVFVGVLLVLGRTPVVSDLGVGRSVAFVVGTLAAGVVLSVGTYVVGLRPFLTDPTGVRRAGRDADIVGWVTGAIATGLALRAVVGLVFTGQAYAVPDPLHLSSLTESGVVSLPLHATVPVRVFGVLGVGIVVAVAAQVLLVRGRTGLALRAVAVDPGAAALMGVRVERLRLLAFAVAGLLAGVAGLLAAPAAPLSVEAAVVLGLKGVAAAYVGGLGSLRGPLIGGLAVGVAESVAVNWSVLGAGYADVVPLAILVVVVALRPEGIGRPVAVTDE